MPDKVGVQIRDHPMAESYVPALDFLWSRACDTPNAGFSK